MSINRTEQKIEFTSKLFAALAAFSGKWSAHIMNAVDNLNASVAGAIPGAPALPSSGTAAGGATGGGASTGGATAGGAIAGGATGTSSTAPGFSFVTETNKAKYSMAAKGMAGGTILLGAASGALGITNLFQPGDMDRIGEAIENLDARLDENADALKQNIQKLGDEVIALIQHESLDSARSRIFHAELMIENYKKNFMSLLSGYINLNGEITNIGLETPPNLYINFIYNQIYPCPYELGPTNLATYFTADQLNDKTRAKGLRAKPTFINDLFNGRNLNFGDGNNTFYVQCKINTTTNSNGAFIASLNSFANKIDKNGVVLEDDFSISTYCTGANWPSLEAISSRSDWEILTYINETDFPTAELAAASSNWKKPTNKKPYSIAMRKSGDKPIKFIKFLDLTSGEQRLLSFNNMSFEWSETLINGTLLNKYYEVDYFYYDLFNISKKNTLLLSSCKNNVSISDNILNSKIIKIDFEENILYYNFNSNLNPTDPLYNKAIFENNTPSFVAMNEIVYEYFGKKDIVQIILNNNSTITYDSVSKRWIDGNSFAFEEANDFYYKTFLNIERDDIPSSNYLLLIDYNMNYSYKIDLFNGDVNLGGFNLGNQSLGPRYGDYSIINIIYQTDKKIGYHHPFGEVSGIEDETNAQWIWDDSSNQYAWIRCKMSYNLEAHANMENYFKQVNQANVINYISDDLADAIFKIFMLTLNMDNYSKQGIFDMVYTQTYNNSLFPDTTSKKTEAGYVLSLTASYYTQLILRGLKALAFIRTTKAEAKYLRANNIAHVSQLSKDQQAELQANQSFEIYGLVELFANSNEDISLWKKLENKLSSIPANY